MYLFFYIIYYLSNDVNYFLTIFVILPIYLPFISTFYILINSVLYIYYVFICRNLIFIYRFVIITNIEPSNIWTGFASG